MFVFCLSLKSKVYNFLPNRSYTIIILYFTEYWLRLQFFKKLNKPVILTHAIKFDLIKKIDTFQFEN